MTSLPGHRTARESPMKPTDAAFSALDPVDCPGMLMLRGFEYEQVAPLIDMARGKERSPD
jgi:hypothetical protein